MSTVLDRVRTYAEAEPSFTVAFASWELGISNSAVWLAVVSMLKADELREIESARGPYGATYEWAAAQGEPPRAMPDPERDSALQRAMCDALDGGPKTLGAIVKTMQLPKPRVRSLLDVLIASGQVSKSGQTKGTRYGLVASAPVDRMGAAHLHVVTGGTAPRELDDREVAYTTEAGPRALAG